MQTPFWALSHTYRSRIGLLLAAALVAAVALSGTYHWLQPTEAAGPAPDMALRVWAGYGTGGPQLCDTAASAGSCAVNLAPGAAFTIGIVTNGIPLTGYDSYHAGLNFPPAGITMQDQLPGSAENDWPASDPCAFPAETVNLGIAFYRIGCGKSAPNVNSLYAGVLADVRFTCDSAATITLDSSAETYYKDLPSTTVLIKTGDSVGINCLPPTPTPTNTPTRTPTLTPTLTPTPTATSVPGYGTSISGGQYLHSCVVTVEHAAKCWGYNYAAQLGDATTTGSTEPVLVSVVPASVAEVSAGFGHTCAIMMPNGAVKCWGENSFGQLGDGSTANSYTAVDVVGVASGAVGIEAGQDHTCAVMSGGGVKCWGRNDRGQLGDGQACGMISCPTPVNVLGLNNITAISVGDTHSCARKADGSVSCWGSNADGELGNGTTTYTQAQPVSVIGLTDAVGVAVGAVHTCAVRAGGGVRCWGWNGYGQLGNGAYGGVLTTPVDVQTLTNATAIAAGNYHSCALKDDGSIDCWGQNTYGQLGTGTSTGPEQCSGPQPCSTTPANVSGLPDGVATISAGTTHTCVLTVAGLGLCWGLNNVGQLGNGTDSGPESCAGNPCSTAPVSIVGIPAGPGATPTPRPTITTTPTPTVTLVPTVTQTPTITLTPTITTTPAVTATGSPRCQPLRQRLRRQGHAHQRRASLRSRQ